MRIAVDPTRCEGHGRCYDLAPGLLAPDDVGHAVLIDADGAVPSGAEADAERVVRNCPEQALSLEA